MKFNKVVLAIAAIVSANAFAKVSMEVVGRTYDQLEAAYEEGKAALERLQKNISSMKTEIDKLKQECPIATYNPAALLRSEEARAKASACAKKSLEIANKAADVAKLEFEQAQKSMTVANIKADLDAAKKAEAKK